MHHYLLQEEQQQIQQLELSVKCFDLINQSHGIPLDSFIIVKLIEKNKTIKQLVKSKVYWGCSNPQYQQKFNLEFCFKNEQNLLFQVFSHQAKPRLYGWIQTTVSKIFGPRNKTFEDKLKIDGKQKNKVTYSRIQVVCKKKQKQLDQIQCWKLKIKSSQIKPLRSFYLFTSKSPYFFIITKQLKNSESIIYKSQYSQQFDQCQFKQTDILRKALHEKFCEYHIKLYQGADQNEKLIGSLTFDPVDLQIKKTLYLDLKNSSNQKVGKIQMSLMQKFPKYSLTDYLDAGLQFKVVCNIDFTASNKKPSDPQSLHRIGGEGSAYQLALKNALKILLDYDQDKMIPTYGFGAKVFMPNFNSEGKVSHCFPLNGDIVNPSLSQVDGVIQCYQKSLQYLQFAGPTNFSQIIKNAINQCETFCSDLSQYMIVFIMTDGQLHDIYPVIDLIDKHSHLPMSIIIVGLGDNDFSQIVQLDGDQYPLLNSRGKKVRDVVQFVDYNQCHDSKTSLAVNILQEIPDQILNFYNENKVYPKKMKQIKSEKSKCQVSKLLKSTSIDRDRDSILDKSSVEKKTMRFNSSVKSQEKLQKILTDSVLMAFP